MSDYFDTKNLEKPSYQCRFYNCFADHENCSQGFCEKHHNEKIPHPAKAEVLSPEEKRKKKQAYYKAWAAKQPKSYWEKLNRERRERAKKA